MTFTRQEMDAMKRLLSVMKDASLDPSIREGARLQFDAIYAEAKHREQTEGNT